MSQPVLFGDARQAGGEHDHGEANQAHFRPVKGERNHQEDGYQGLRDNFRFLFRRPPLLLDPVILLENAPRGLGHLRAVTQDAQFLHHDTGQ